MLEYPNCGAILPILVGKVKGFILKAATKTQGEVGADGVLS
jgi:hypothetical protein